VQENVSTTKLIFLILQHLRYSKTVYYGMIICFTMVVEAIENSTCSRLAEKLLIVLPNCLDKARGVFNFYVFCTYGV